MFLFGTSFYNTPVIIKQLVFDRSDLLLYIVFVFLQFLVLETFVSLSDTKMQRIYKCCPLFSLNQFIVSVKCEI